MTNMPNIAFTAVVACAVLGAAATAHAVPVIADSVNSGANPSSSTWTAEEVGWFYTPAFAYGLVGIETKFGSTDGRTVTLEIYDEHPGSGGTLLRSGTFSPLDTAFAGMFFAELALVAGEDYFIGFRNVEDLELNTTLDAGAASLGLVWYSFDDEGAYTFSQSGTVTQPLLLFYQDMTASIPEPATAALASIGFAGFTFLRRRKTT